MKNLLLFIKLNGSSAAVKNAINYVEDSYINEREHFYYTSDKDTEMFQHFFSSISAEDFAGHYIAFVEYRKNPKTYISKIYIAEAARLEQNGSSYQIHYLVKHKITSRLVIDNFIQCSTLSIEQDFEDDSHISIEDSAPLIRQLLYAINCPQNIGNQTIEYPRLDSENTLSEFAQRNEYCKRFYNILSCSKTRGEYQRDYDRIVHCKAFRRMVDKAQIFTSSKGDHYRTRMTHTLCVTQIARSIASRLNMNVALTEAIALGHDLGHTPFGHQGERTLNSMAQKYAGIGFKHNYQSINVASFLEEEYIECAGLDLSIQVLEGMWKHTKIRKKPTTPLACTLKDFLPYDISDNLLSFLHPENDFCSTIEGQIVFIADEIAQRSHDLDDALSARLITMDSLMEALSLKKLKTLKDQIERLKTSMLASKEKQHVFVSEDELLNSRVAAQVTNYFINDVVDNYKNHMENQHEAEAIRRHFAANKSVDRSVICFSNAGNTLNKYLETIVKKQVINSPEVAAFDDKAERVVTKLFELYYNNPRLLHDGTLQRIYIEMRKRTENVIHFQDADIDIVNNEWKRIKSPRDSGRLCDIQHLFPQEDFSVYSDVSSEDLNKFKESLDKACEEYSKVEEYIMACYHEYCTKNKILVRSICDFISGMTDTYATNEYKKLI